MSSNLPPDTTFVHENRRLIEGWLQYLRRLEPAASFSKAFVDALVELSPADIAVLQQLIVAAGEPVPEVPVVPPYATETQVFDEDGTWVKPGFGSIARVQIWAGGGSGAKAATSQNATGGGGGSHREEWFFLSALADTVAVTVGPGGVGVSSNGDGNPGQNSSFGSLFTVYGGGAGQFGASDANTAGGFGAGLTSGSTGIGATAGSSSFVSATSLDGGAPGGGAAGSGTDVSRAGGNALRGGAGGGGKCGLTDAIGGVSELGGAGGNGSNGGTATNGTAPAGGGGAGDTGTSGAGGNGRCIVTVF